MIPDHRTHAPTAATTAGKLAGIAHGLDWCAWRLTYVADEITADLTPITRADLIRGRWGVTL